MICKNRFHVCLAFAIALPLFICVLYFGIDFTPIRSCPIETLILDEKLLPEGTFAEKLYSPSPDVPSESASRSFYYAPDAIYHRVIRWGTIRWARDQYDKDSKTAFEVDKYGGPWETPEEVDYVSSIADQYRVACAPVGQIYQCNMVAQYEEYSVFFGADVSEKGISLQAVNELIKAIDDRMSECLGK